MRATLKRRGLMAAAAVAGLSVSTGVSVASVIYSQTFSEGTYTKGGGGVAVIPPAGLYNGNTTSLLTYYTGGTGTFSVDDNFSTIGTGLDFNTSGQYLKSGSLPSGTAVLGNAVGDTLSYGFTFLIPNPGATDDSTSFKFGIFNDNGTPVTAGNSSGLASGNDDFGYSAFIGVGTDNLQIQDQPGNGVVPLQANSSNYTLLSAAESGLNIGDGKAHSVLFTFTYEGPNSVNVAFSVDGTQYFSGLDTSPNPVTSFNDVQFYERDSLEYIFNNVQISATSVPEPICATMLGLGSLGLMLGRRRRV